MKLFVRYIAISFVAFVFGWCLWLITNQWSLKYLNDFIREDKTKHEIMEHEALAGNVQNTITKVSRRVNSTRNDLIERYKETNENMAGENGRGIILAVDEKSLGDEALNLYHVNTKVSDLVSLNRKVPDSRPLPCRNLVFDESNLPLAAVVIPFHNEWPSILLRTIYSIINRTPQSLLKEIILVDDASSLDSLKEPLDDYIESHFPRNLIQIIRLKERSGIVNARLQGLNLVTAEVVCIFDSHMEVNIDWLQPLLVEIKKNQSTVVMSQLDYIRPDTLLYDFNRDYKPRYGFDWKLVFFENYFRDDQLPGKSLTDVFPGVVMVGSAFAVNTKYFKQIGAYDPGMKIWGGENLELSWRVSMCGGQLIHSLCSHIGHIARSQPYDFPGGRKKTELYNYKRAVDLWMGPYKKYVYNAHPLMKDIDAGNLKDRMLIKKRLHCKSFDWYLDNIWPELFRFERNVTSSGQLFNLGEKLCLDNNNYFYQSPLRFSARKCTNIFADQGFSITNDKKLRTSLNCVGTQCEKDICFAVLTDCLDPSLDQWEYTKDGYLRSNKNLCLDLEKEEVIASLCKASSDTQKWTFIPIILETWVEYFRST